MWDQIERQLAHLLSNKIFPGLLPVPDYRALLRPNGQPDPNLCAAKSKVIVATARDGIREFGSGGPPKVEEWKEPICRAVSPRNRPDGQWWFEESLVQRWSRRYPPATPGRKQKILDSLRPMLAVCHDWNDFTDLVVIRPTSPIPAIVGQGSHKGIYSSADPRHHAYPNVFFIGGFRQVFLPFVNPGIIKKYPL